MQINKNTLSELQSIDVFDLLKKQKNRIVNLFIIALALFIAFNIHAKQSKQARAYKDKITVETEKNVLLKKLEDIIKDFEAYDQVMPLGETDELVKTLSEIAKETDVKIISLRPQNRQIVGNYIKTPFDLKISCFSYSVLGSFIAKLENSKEFFQVDSFVVSFDGGEEGVFGLTVSNIALRK
ncbi:MAG: type 4a pilus biogenesis protein PilO [Candidatus Omnitrophica bacterium]|nr:type 4a pilus biogenesis protein PilO [Candidatus Omnitrophota bacterium]